MDYKRQVSIGIDGEDFVVALLTGNEVAFRTKNARALTGDPLVDEVVPRTIDFKI